MEKVSDNIINVGVNDRDITVFEGQYELEQGMAYNSYVILDDLITIMDTVDARVTGEWLNNLAQVLKGKTPEYVVVQHMEPDHSASLMELIDTYPDIKVVTGMQAANMMKQFYDADLSSRITTVKEGDTLNLGNHQLQFIAAPMVHWPEVIVTYESTEKVLFSADAFGKFGTRDADEDWLCEARRYYFNIVGKYGMQVQNLLKKVSALDIQTICSLHGPVLTENLDFYIGKYDIWSKYEPEDDGVFIAYASAHGNTAHAAKLLMEILKEQGVEKVAIADLSREDIHEAVEDAFRYNRLVLAAISYDAGLFPPMERLLNILKAKNYQNRKVAVIENGSWAPSAAKIMKQYLESMKNIEIVEPVVTIRSSAKAADIEKLKELAVALL